MEWEAQESQRRASETGRSAGVKEIEDRRGWGPPLVTQAQPYHGALCDGALGIPCPGNSLIEKYESSHTEKMAPQ